LELNKAGRRTPGRQSGYLLLFVILAIAALVRFPGLDRTSLWYDEAVSWAQSSGSFADLMSMVAQDNYPPLHNIVLWLTIPVLGDGETALRLPSALLGLLAVGLMVPIGTMLLDRWAGLLAAALLAVSPYHIWFSTEARMYALLAAAGLAFLLTVLKTLRSPDRGWLAALVLTGALFLYSHIYALLGFASVGLVCAGYALRDLVMGKPFWRSSAVKACCAMGVSTLLFLPWLVILANRARSVAEEGFWIAYPDLTFLKGVAFSLAGSLAAFWILATLATVALWPGASGSRDKLPTRFSNGMLVCAAYSLGPPVLAYLYSVLVQPILFDRYLIAAWPGVLLLASVGARRLAPRIAPQIAPLALIAAMLFLTYPELKFTLREKIRPEWRLIVQDYLGNRSDDDRLALYKGFASPALAYYLRGPNAFETARTPADLDRLAESGIRWMLVVHSDPGETAKAAAAFGTEGSPPVARRFGWGASGLSLFKAPSAD
jgi:mannosyltransferase